MVLAVITIAPAIYLVLTSLTPLNLTLPDTAWDFSTPAGNYLDLARGSPLHALGLGPGQAVGGDRRPAAAGGPRRGAVVERVSRIREMARSGFLIPMVLPPIVVGILWRVMYAVDISPFHRFMAFIGLPVPSLITNPNSALMAIVIAETWEWFPFTMLMAAGGACR